MLAVLRRNPAFRRLWLAQVVSQAGDWLTRTAILSLIGELGGAQAAARLGLLYGIDLIVHMLPTAFFSPLAGSLADRLPRRALMIAADLARAAVVLGYLFVDQPDELWLLYALMLVQMGIGIFFDSARSGALPSTVRKEDLYEAYALSAATWSIMLALGACAGGFALLWVGRQGVFLLDCASYVGSALCLAGLRLPSTQRPEKAFSWIDVIALREISAALRYTRTLGLGSVLGAKIFWGVGGGFLVLLSVVAVVRFGAGAAEFAPADALQSPDLGRAGLAIGWLYAARGVGTGLGPFLARAWYGTGEAGLRGHIASGFGFAAVGYGSLAFASSLTAAVVCIAFAHMGGSALWVASTTLWQRRVEDHWRGRVHALDFFGMTLSFSVFGLAIGLLYDCWGSLEGVLLVHATLTLLAGAIWWLWSRASLREKTGLRLSKH